MSDNEKTLQDYLEDDAYRRGVGIVLHKNGKVFVGKRSDVKNAWQMPQGGVDAGEDLLEAARRELFEETGLCKEQMELNAVYADFTVYTLPENLQKIGFKGQIQKWFLFEFKEEDNVIDLTKAQDKEFSDWRWDDVDTVISSSVDFRKSVYKDVFKAFGVRISKAVETAEKDGD